jgi:hypothetical protein
MSPVSLRPSEMVEGGAVPVDQNLTWKNPEFVLFDYQGKAKNTTALHLTLVSDDGTEHEQYYSVGDPERFSPSEDGKRVDPVGAAQALSKSSNFYLLMDALVKAGFPENRIGDDITILNGLVAFHIGLAEPKRAGLAKAPAADGSVAREKILSVPSTIIKFPWDKKATGKVAPKTGAKAPQAAAVDEEVVAAAVAFAKRAIDAKGDAMTRQQLGVAAYKDKELAKDPATRDSIAKAVYTPEFSAAAIGEGMTVDGDSISV